MNHTEAYCRLCFDLFHISKVCTNIPQNIQVALLQKWNFNNTTTFENKPRGSKNCAKAQYGGQDQGETNYVPARSPTDLEQNRGPEPNQPGTSRTMKPQNYNTGTRRWPDLHFSYTLTLNYTTVENLSQVGD